MTPIELILSRLPDVRKNGDGWSARCPAHNDENPSLSISEGKDGRVLVNCFAGCEFESILSAVDLTPSDAFVRENEMQVSEPIQATSQNGRAFPTVAAATSHLEKALGAEQSGTWVYQDSIGDEVFRVVRFDKCTKGRPKQYRPLFKGTLGYHIGDPPGTLPLYGLPELGDAPTLWVCEGEKCAEILRELRLIATTNAHGANATHKTDWSVSAGKDVVLCPDKGSTGEKHVSQILEHLSVLSPSPTVRIVRLPLENDGDDIEQFVEGWRNRGATDDEIRVELERLADAAPVVYPKQELVTMKLSDVAPEEQPFLWPGRIPSASCTLVGGRQGCTKNLFIYEIIARVTTGEPWMDDPAGLRREPSSVILLEAEEHLESSIVPRLAAAGADLSRVYFIAGAPTQDPERTRFISIQRDVDGIERLAERLGDVGLVVVSPVTSYLGNVEQNSNEQVRNEVIHPLKSLAERVECAVVIIKHPNKDWKNSDPLGRIGGSAAWTEAMRCVVYIGNDPDEEDDEKNPRRCAFWVKYSIGLTPDPLSWKVRVADSGAPAIFYISEPINFTADEMLVGSRRMEERKSKREFAAEWIAGALENGPMAAPDLNKAAMAAVEKERQFSMDAFDRARADLRKSGQLAYERKPNMEATEWWYWLTDAAAPEWYSSETVEE